MRAILRFLGSRWFLTFVGVVLLSLLVWWFGPFLSLLEGWIAIDDYVGLPDRIPCGAILLLKNDNAPVSGLLGFHAGV